MYDVIVIGGGVVGIGIVHMLSRSRGPPPRVLLLEQASHLLGGASRGNSAMIHTGFDAAPNSLEASLVCRGHKLFWSWVRRRRDKQGLPTIVKKNGALMCARSEQEVVALKNTIQRRAQENGVPTQLLTPEEVYALEPGLSSGVLCALRIPDESIVDPWLTPMLYLEEARRNWPQHVTIRLRARVVSVQGSGAVWCVSCDDGVVHRGRVVINAAGLHGDSVDRMMRCRNKNNSNTTFEVYPRTGRYICYPPQTSAYVSHMLLPLPTKKTKGVIVFPTVYGDVVAGPTAEDPGERRRDHESVRKQLIAAATRQLPLLAAHPISWEYAGNRPALVGQSDYLISLDHRHDDQKRVAVTVAGIRSTGLSACLAIGEHVRGLLVECGALTGHEYSTRGDDGFGEMKWEHVRVEDILATAVHITHPISQRANSSKL